MILGASKDSPEAQKAFKTKNNLPYTLVSDPKGELAAALGITAARQTAVVDKDGKLEKLYTAVKPVEHAKEVATDLAKK